MLENITNHFHPEMERPKLPVQTKIVHLPNDEWNYAHHPFIAYFKGRYFLYYSCGHNNEDDVGQHIRYTQSDDFVHWDEERVLAVPDNPATGVLIPDGWYATEDTLVIHYLHFDYKPEVLRNGRRQMGSAGRVNWCTYCITSQDGVTWSEPMLQENYGGNMPVQRLQSGRLFSCGGSEIAYTDNPDGIHGWKGVTLFPDGYGNDPSDTRTEDDQPGLVSDTHVSLCEGSFFQQDSGRIYVFLRSATPWLWACYSDDDGETWTLPEKTNFTDNRTKFTLGRLPDGRYFYIGTPDPFPPRTRHVLALSLSKDGLDYTQHYLLATDQYKGRYPAIDKNGVYGYPTCLVKDGHMYITYSLNKEMIAVMNLDLSNV